MECDDVMLLLASHAQRTLTPVEETRVREHATGCEACRALATEVRENWRWLVKVPGDSVPALDVLATIDPIVFEASTEVTTGGMGRITRAFDRRLAREVAIKEVLDADLQRRFEREVRITARLQHPAIVPIYEAGRFPDGNAFYTMRFVTGRTLQQAIESRGGLGSIESRGGLGSIESRGGLGSIDAAPTLRERLMLMPHVRAVADALAYAHARGVIHRDLKPGNVLVGEFGETVVIDWGLAKELDDDDDELPAHALATGLTRTGSVMGTPCFMSPEQAAGHEVDAADDVYALGAVLYHVLVGKPPYWDTAQHEADALIAATIAGPPTPIPALVPEAPPDLCAIAAHAMSRDKAGRYPTAKELADELARFEAGQLLASRKYSIRELAARWLRRHRRAAILAALAAVTAIVLAVTYARYQRAAEELAIRARGAQLTDLYGDVARQGYLIDRDLLRLENALEGLAAAAAWALEGPERADTKVYFDTDFAVPEQRPSDFTDRTAYRWPVSVEYPVVGVAPGVDREAHRGKLRRLAPLRTHIREMVLEAAVGDPTSITDPNPILLARKSPIDYAYVDLPEGLHIVWPGMDGLRRTYDVRTSSFYVMSAHRRGKRWGAPYIDSTTDRNGDDLVLPCTKGIWSPAGAFLGVAGVEITVTKMVETSMALPSRAALRASLVDGRGRKVIDTFDANKRFTSGDRDTEIAFTDFDLPDVVAAIRAGREGVRETKRDGRGVVAAFTRLETIGWYYVVEVDAASLGRR